MPTSTVVDGADVLAPTTVVVAPPASVSSVAVAGDANGDEHGEGRDDDDGRDDRAADVTEPGAAR